jgi:hypothetical protein
MKSKPKHCRRFRCKIPLYRSGFCELHFHEDQKNQARRDSALRVLHTGLIEGALPKNSTLTSELEDVRKWWDRVCRTTNYGIEDKVLVDEVEYAAEWCIAIAQEIIDEGKVLNEGKLPNHSSIHIKEIAWVKFKNLEKGLMSNGVPRMNDFD